MIKEVEVEKVVEVERVVEVPVEREVVREIVREVPVDRVVEVEKLVGMREEEVEAMKQAHDGTRPGRTARNDCWPIPSPHCSSPTTGPSGAG